MRGGTAGEVAARKCGGGMYQEKIEAEVTAEQILGECQETEQGDDKSAALPEKT
jgi:hypothetical protein